MVDVNEGKLKLKFVSPVFRASYVHIVEPGENLNGELEYGMEMIFEKDTDFSDMKQTIQNAFIVRFGPDKSKWPKPLRIPLRDGNAERPDNDLYSDCFFAKCKSRTKPGIVDTNLNEIIDPEELYSGMYARASIYCHVYVQPSNGVTFLLNNVMKVRDGDRLDGKASAQDDFDDFKEETSRPSISGVDIFS